MIVWLTGQPGAGKTTIANALKASYEAEGAMVKTWIIDGDDLRALMPETYDEVGRRRNVMKAQAIARFLFNRGQNVIVALVSPYRDQRMSFKMMGDVAEIYLYTKEIRGKEHFFVEDYQPPYKDFLPLDTGENNIEECVDEIRSFCGSLSTIPPGPRMADKPIPGTRESRPHSCESG